ncbi:MAG: hypothetical protein R2705_09775 [Ilumatobacteraceae bacterium]
MHSSPGRALRIGIGAGPGPGGPFAVERDLPESPSRSLGERHAWVESLVAGIRSSELLADRSVVIGANSTALSAVAGRLADGLNVSVDHPLRRVHPGRAGRRRAIGGSNVRPGRGGAPNWPIRHLPTAER